MRALSRRRLLGWTLAAGAAAVSAACGGAAPTPAPTRPAGPTTPPTAAPTTAPAAPPTPAPAAPPAAAPTAPPAARPAEPTPTAAAAAAPAAKPAGSAQPVTLRFHMRAGEEKTEPANYVVRPQEWEQQSGHQVKLEPIPAGADDTEYVLKIDALASSGTIGDLLFTPAIYGQHAHFVKAGIIEPVDDLLASAGIKKTEWLAGIVDGMTFNGKMYGLPRTGHPGDSYIWLNLKMLDEAGIKRPQTYGNSVEDVAGWATRLSKGPKDRREVYGYAASITGGQAITNGIRQFGGDVVDKDGATSLADSDPWWDWARWHNQLIVAEKAHPLGQDLPSGGLPALFAAEKVATVHAARAFHNAQRRGVQEKFPVATIQYPRGPKALGWGMSINTHSGTTSSKSKEIAFSLLYALGDRRMAYLVGKENGYLIGRVDNLDALKELAEDPFLKLQQRCSEESVNFWTARNFRGAEVIRGITNHMDLVWLGKRPLDRPLMGELKKTLDEVLARPA